VGHRDRDVFHLNQIFKVNFAGILDDRSARSSPKSFCTSFSSCTMIRAASCRKPEYRGTRDLDLNGGKLIHNLLNFHAVSAELQLDDGLGLLLGKFEGADQAFARFLRSLRSADQLMTASRLSRAFLNPSKICSRSRAFRKGSRCAANHVDAMIDERRRTSTNPARRLAIDDGQHNNAKVYLKLRVFV